MKKTILALLGVALFVAWVTSIANAQGYAAILEKIDNLEAKINQLEGKISSAGDQSGIPKFESRLSGLEKRIISLSENKADLAKINTRLANLENRTEGSPPSTDLNQIEELVADLTARVSELENNIAMVNESENNNIQNQESGDDISGLKAEVNTFSIEHENEPQPEAEMTGESSISLENIELSGFFDLIYSNPQNSKEDKGFAINQMEVDIESQFSPFITIAGAIAYGGEAFEIGAAYADLHWMGDLGSHPIQSQVFDHSGLLVGQFDIPFGADYEKIASPDRPLVSAPLAVEETIDGWNDVGLNLYGGQELWEAQAYFVNGDQDNMAYGGRLTLMVSEFLRIGGSSASILNGDDQPQANFFGGDAVFSYEPVEITGEYILKQDDLQAEQINISGYYVEGKIGLATWLKKDFYLVGGYSAVEHKDIETSQITAQLNRATVGAGFNLNDNASMRFEYLLNGGDDIEDANLAIGQFLVSF